MGFTIYIIYILAILIVLFSYYNIKLSIALYLSYMILIPYLSFNIGGVPFSYNMVNTILIFAFFLKKKEQLDWRNLMPFLFLFFSLFLLTFLQDSMPWSVQFHGWRSGLMASCILPFLFWNVSLEDPKAIEYSKWALIISITIAGIYGIYLMRLHGRNPYTSFLADYFDKTDTALMFEDMPARIGFSNAGKIQATMRHPMIWAIHLCFLIIVFFTYYLKEKSYLYLILIFLIGINILAAGVRTGIVALMFGYIYFLMMNGQFKKIIYGLIILLLFYIVIISNAQLSNMFASFTDIEGNKSNVGGSTIVGRLYQLEGAYYEITGHELIGKGYGWASYYLEHHDAHPILYYFESLVFVVLCNSGLVGVIIWLIFFLSLLRLNRKLLNLRENIVSMDILVIVYASYAIGTGDYGYLEVFSFYYTFLLRSLLNNETINQNMEIYA